ncbi:hypothetical protein K438DRAFT_1768007 [Mycena galopus ATCC 62051]|nr:hypothetical protein K438DRAFT_1768007 [Mycena galopus ATCC 62051]
MFIRFRLAALGHPNPELVDVALSQVDGLECQEVLVCNATTLVEEYGITGALAPREEVYGFNVLVQQLEWATAHPAEARLIQQPGLNGARHLVTDEQSDCYYLLTLLEWVRLQDYTKGLPMHK